MVDSSVIGLITTFWLNVLLFGIILVVYCAIKNYRSKSLDPEIFPITERPVFEEHTMSVKDVWYRVFTLSDDSIILTRTTEGLIYLKLHLRLIVAFIILSLLGCGILIPIYSTGDSDEAEEDAQRGTLINILFEDKLLVGTIVLLFVFTVIVYYVLLRFYAEAIVYKK
jgi:hypothetical protein